LNGTDKWADHWYAAHYQLHFQPFRKRKINLLEIGIGGYADPKAGGDSLRMWRSYFPNATIFGIDIYDKSSHEESRIKILRGSQADQVLLRQVSERAGGFDIVIDDGSHVSEHVVTSFQTLFPLLRRGGIYAVEDTQTSYWPEFGGDTHDRSDVRTTMGFFKSLVDGLNYSEFTDVDRAPNYLDQNIISVHFYHNLVFIYKGDNREGRSSFARKEWQR